MEAVETLDDDLVIVAMFVVVVLTAATFLPSGRITNGNLETFPLSGRI